MVETARQGKRAPRDPEKKPATPRSTKAQRRHVVDTMDRFDNA